MNAPSNRLRYLSLSGLALFGLGVIGTAYAQSAENTPMAKHQIVAELHKVSLQTVPLSSSRPGTVVPDQKAKIASRLMGYIRSLDVNIGDEVKAGQLLFAIDPSNILSQQSQTASKVVQAEAALADAQMDLTRFSSLYEEESVSKRQLDKIKLQFKVAHEKLSAAKASNKQAQAQGTYAYVRAPFDGVVVQKMAVTGDLASPGHPVLVLENPQRLSVKFDVSDALYRTLSIGQSTTVRIDGLADAQQLKISQLVSAANPVSHSHRVKLALPKTLNVNSGSFARVYIQHGTREVLLVPQAAVITRAGITGVFISDDRHIAHFRMLRSGLRIGDQIEVQAGLIEGDRVLITGLTYVRNGDRVMSKANEDE